MKQRNADNQKGVNREGPGQRVRELRRERGLTQKELAAKAGVARQTLMNQEHRPERASRALDKIAKALDVSESYLRYGVEEIALSEHFEAPDGRAPQVSWVPIYNMRSGYQAARQGTHNVGPDAIDTTTHTVPLIGLRIDDDSLVRPDGQGIPEGTLVMFARTTPSASVQVRPGDLVVIELPAIETLAVRRVRSQNFAGQWAFVADNPYYSEVGTHEGAKIVGVVSEIRTHLGVLAKQPQTAATETATSAA